MAELEEMDGSQGQGAQGSGQAGGVQAAQAAGGQEGASQGSQEQDTGAGTQAPPQLPPRALRLSSVQDDTIREYIAKIKSEMEIQTKTYRWQITDSQVLTKWYLSESGPVRKTQSEGAHSAVIIESNPISS